jgi:hypothetical protein
VTRILPSAFGLSAVLAINSTAADLPEGFACLADIDRTIARDMRYSHPEPLRPIRSIIHVWRETA